MFAGGLLKSFSVANQLGHRATRKRHSVEVLLPLLREGERYQLDECLSWRQLVVNDDGGRKWSPGDTRSRARVRGKERRVITHLQLKVSSRELRDRRCDMLGKTQNVITSSNCKLSLQKQKSEKWHNLLSDALRCAPDVDFHFVASSLRAPLAFALF